MSGVNKVILVGNLGRDPETKSFANGGSVTEAVLATSEKWKDKNTGEWQERTEWHSLKFNGKLAEIAQQWLTKGSKIYCEGKIQTRKWEDKEGNERYKVEIVVLTMQMLGTKKKEQGAPPAAANQSQEGFDDDIPF